MVSMRFYPTDHLEIFLFGAQPALNPGSTLILTAPPHRTIFGACEFIPNFTSMTLFRSHLNQCQRTLDGNHQCNQFNKNNDPDDVSLCAGKAYFPEHQEYQSYLAKVPTSREVCSIFICIIGLNQCAEIDL
jgi:hypothetical protein